MTTYEDLLDYRRRVADLYATLRQHGSGTAATCAQFRTARDELFKSHPQSALADEHKAAFSGLNYYAYNPAWRFLVSIEPDPDEYVFQINLPNDGPMHLQRFGRIHFTIENQSVSLALYWILAYGGGLFLPFRDMSNGQETYGGGRYLLDTIKHADLGQEGDRLIIDFNYAYNPSCAYNERWGCPLAPTENHLSIAIPAGEQRYIC